MQTFLRSLAKKLGYVAAGCIILAAILVIVSRLLTPALNEHRADFEKWASDLLVMPVSIQNVQVSWAGYQPEISLHQVTIFSKENKEPALQIQKISVFVSIFSSLWQRKFVPSGIKISGTDISIHQNANGEFSIRGFPTFGLNQPLQGETKFVDMLNLLSQQKWLMLQNINVSFHQSTKEKYFFTLYNLTLKNSGLNHTISGKAILHQTMSTELLVMIQWVGEKIELDKIKAKIYLYAKGLLLTQWLKDYVWQGWQIKSGVASTKIWATWAKGNFRKIQTSSQLYKLNLYSQTDKSTHVINRLSGNVGWKRLANKQIIAADDILIDLPSRLWPVTNFYLSFNHADGNIAPYTLDIAYLHLEDLQPFLFSSPNILSDENKKILNDLKLKSVIQNLSIKFFQPYTDWKNYRLEADFNQLSFAPWQKLPGINNLSGTLEWNNGEGNVSLNSKETIIQYASIFSKPLDFDQLSGQIKVKLQQDNNWLLTLSKLDILTSDGGANINGTITIPATEPTKIDLTANFTLQKAAHAVRYLPMEIFDADLVKWLRAAFSGGEVHSGNAILRGVLNDFPFDNNNGTFLIAGNVKNVDLDYAPDWPRLKHVTGKLVFSGRKMFVDADAEIFDIDVKNIHAEIADLNNPILKVRGDKIQTDFVQALKFVHASPLEKTLGKMFTGISLHGPITLDLGLEIPLSNADRTQVKGDIDIQNGQLTASAWQLAIKNLIGKLHFTEKSAEGKNLQATLFNKSFTFNVATQEKTSVIQASFSEELSVADLEKWLKISIANIAKGKAIVDGAIDFSLDKPLVLHLRSNLVGLALDLPDIYGKTLHENKELSAEITVQQDKPLLVKAEYAKLISAALILEHAQNKFNLIAADLRLGGGDPAVPQGKGLYITGAMPEIDWDKVKDSMNHSKNSYLSGLQLHNIDISTKVLKIFGQRLSQVRLQLTPSANRWLIKVNSDEIDGEIDAPNNFSAAGMVTARFQRIDLHTGPASTKRTPISVKDVPAISLQANRVTYDDMLIGQVNVKTSKSSSGLTIQSFTIDAPNMNLNASGSWTASGTHLSGNASSAKVSNLLTDLGFDVANFVASSGKLKFDLEWGDAPFALSFGNLQGRANLDLGKGRIVDVGAASGAKMELGRMLSIFSLQTLPRRLMFDFSDIFQKGYSFDFVRGE